MVQSSVTRRFFFASVERTRERGFSFVPAEDQAQIAFLEPFGYQAGPAFAAALPLTIDSIRSRVTSTCHPTSNGRRIYETFTDLSGRFSFTGLGRGRYQITAEGDGQSFDTTSVYAEVSAFGAAPQLFSQDVQLRSLPGKTLPRAGVVSSFSQDVPKRAREALEKSIELSGEGKAEAAVEKILEAIKAFPEYFEAHFNLETAFLKPGV